MSTIGIDLGGTNLRGLLLGSDGKQCGMIRGPIGDEHDPATLVERVAARVRMLLADVPAGDPVQGVGLGIAGWVRPGDGWVVKAPNLGWQDVPLRRLLETELQLPVLPMNDLSAVAYGEWQQGAAQGVRNALVVFVGTGVGSGLILDGRLHEGAGGFAGEIGHIPVVHRGGRACGCGNRGCLETVAGGIHLEQRLREGARAGRFAGVLQQAAGAADCLTPYHAELAAQAGDTEALELWEEVGEVLGGLLGGLANLLDPEMLVLGGGVMEAGTLRAAVLQHLQDKLLPPLRGTLRVVRPLLGDPAGVIGAALRARHELVGERG